MSRCLMLFVSYIEYFKEAKSLGDILIVTLTTDEFVNKGLIDTFMGLNKG